MIRTLLVIPAIDIKNGKTVRVVQGIPELDCKEYGSDPVEMAKIWRAENAKTIHIVDLDAATDSSGSNTDIIEKICSSVVIPIEVAGGIRRVSDADKLFDAGACRVIITTMAFENRKEFDALLQKHGPKKIAVGIDVVGEEIVINGRKIKTGVTYRQFAKEMQQSGVERLFITDVLRNGMLQGPNILLSKEIAELTGCKITHSGGIRNKDELMDFQKIVPLGVDSVIVGRALYENRFPCQKLWRVAESGIFN